MISHEHYKNGVKMYQGVNLRKMKMEGQEGAVKKVVLESGYEINADVVIIGAGSIINTKLATDAGLNMDMNGGI